MIQLDIISDPICPWCYIGKARLDRALEAHGDNPFDIHWRPFQLNPDMPPEGMDRREYLEAKFGKHRAVSFYAQIAEAAAAAGLDVDFGAIKRTPNTIDAHRMIRWARVEGAQNALVTDLFRRYFAKGEDISDHDVLCAAAKSAAMDPDAIRRLLSGDADAEEIRAEDAGFRQMGVQGVPCFVIGRKYVVNGAQDSELWGKVLSDIAAQEAQA